MSKIVIKVDGVELEQLIEKFIEDKVFAIFPNNKCEIKRSGDFDVFDNDRDYEIEIEVLGER